EDYSVSPSNYAAFGGRYTQTCEPSYTFLNGVSPSCEGWIHSQDGNITHSIAGLAKSATQCTQSIGGVCTIDTIDYWTTTTDPWSKGGPAGRTGGGPGGSIVVKDVSTVLLAGCDLADATGGTWNGPSWF